MLSLSDVIILLLFIGIPTIILMYSYWYLQNKNAELLEAKKTPFLKKLFRIITTPFHFYSVFNKESDTEKENFLFRWYMWFTRFCSRIPFFHFLPKFLVALGAESLIMLITGQKVLAAVLVLWSFTFFLLIYWVESGKKMDEDLITHANKLFLWTVSIALLFLICVYVFFWNDSRAFFDSSFLRGVGDIAHTVNHYIKEGIIWFFTESEWWIKLSAFLLFIIFIIANYRISKIEEAQRKKAKEAKDKESETAKLWNEFLKQQIVK